MGKVYLRSVSLIGLGPGPSEEGVSAHYGGATELEDPEPKSKSRDPALVLPNLIRARPVPLTNGAGSTDGTRNTANESAHGASEAAARSLVLLKTS